jgi:peptidoglycan/LPS O-acetylase OafA/YrhL
MYPNTHRWRRRAAPSRGTVTSVVIGACAASAGAHAGLVPDHLREAPALGIALIVAVVVLGAVGTALAIRPEDRRAAQLAALLLAGLIASWSVSVITGIPVLQPRPESVDGVGLVTKLVETLGLASALWLSQPVDGRRPSTIPEVAR